MRQWEHGGIPCAPYLFLLPTPGSRPPAAGNICLSSPHEAGGGTSVGLQLPCVQETSSPGFSAPDERVTPRNAKVSRGVALPGE